MRLDQIQPESRPRAANRLYGALRLTWIPHSQRGPVFGVGRMLGMGRGLFSPAPIAPEGRPLPSLLILAA